MDEKLPELEPRVSHNFVIKINCLEKKAFESFGAPQTHFRWNFSVSKSRCVYEISQYSVFSAILKLYFWSIHMAKNLILAISSVLNWTITLRDLMQSWFMAEVWAEEKIFFHLKNILLNLVLRLFSVSAKKWFMVSVRLSSYGCTREVGRAREKRLAECF